MDVKKMLQNPELMAHLMQQYDGKTTSLEWQTTRYDRMNIKLKKLFGIDERPMYQRVATWIQQQGRYHTAALEKDYTEARGRYIESITSGGPAELSQNIISSGRTNTGTVEEMVAQNPNTTSELEYITEIGDGSITPGYTGMVNAHTRDNDALQKYYGITKPGKQKYNTDDPMDDTLDLQNVFDVQRAFIRELIGEAKAQKKQQHMYPTAYIQ
jgi:hypothetical protein